MSYEETLSALVAAVLAGGLFLARYVFGLWHYTFKSCPTCEELVTFRRYRAAIWRFVERWFEMPGPYQWTAYQGQRHAVGSALTDGGHGQSLCGLDVVFTPLTGSHGGGCAPECASCDVAWRDALGYSRRPTAAPASVELPSPRTSRATQHRTPARKGAQT